MTIELQVQVEAQLARSQGLMSPYEYEVYCKLQMTAEQREWRKLLDEVQS